MFFFVLWEFFVPPTLGKQLLSCSFLCFFFGGKTERIRSHIFLGSQNVWFTWSQRPRSTTQRHQPIPSPLAGLTLVAGLSLIACLCGYACLNQKKCLRNGKTAHSNGSDPFNQLQSVLRMHHFRIVALWMASAWTIPVGATTVPCTGNYHRKVLSFSFHQFVPAGRGITAPS